VRFEVLLPVSAVARFRLLAWLLTAVFGGLFSLLAKYSVLILALTAGVVLPVTWVATKALFFYLQDSPMP
jgi:hypothetical protein